jgi:hypothetical protein
MRNINSGNACHYSVQKPLPFHPLPTMLKIKIYKTVMLPVVLGVKHGSHFDRKTNYKCLTTKSSGKYPSLRMKKKAIRILHKEELRDLPGSNSIDMIVIPQRIR